MVSFFSKLDPQALKDYYLQVVTPPEAMSDIYAISAAKIAAQIQKMNLMPAMIRIMNGGDYPAIPLALALGDLGIVVDMDYTHTSSYGNSQTAGELKSIAEPHINLENVLPIIVDEVKDTGATFVATRKMCLAKHSAEPITYALTDKLYMHPQETETAFHYFGIPIEYPQFLIGTGLDYTGALTVHGTSRNTKEFRNAPGIFVCLKKDSALAQSLLAAQTEEKSTGLIANSIVTREQLITYQHRPAIAPLFTSKPRLDYLHQQNLEALIAPEQLDEAYDRVADAITQQLGHTLPIIIHDIEASHFAVTLKNRLNCRIEDDYVHLTRDNTQESPQYIWHQLPHYTHLKDRTLIVALNYIGEGHKANAIIEKLVELGATRANISLVVLADKKFKRVMGNPNPDFCVQEITQDVTLAASRFNHAARNMIGPGLFAVKPQQTGQTLSLDSQTVCKPSML